MRRLHRAFTLVELLVVIAIIGVLVALLLPAVQAAREASRRAQCSNNLKQFGIAINSYEGSFKRFPFGKGPSYTGAPVYARWSQHALLLPYLELGGLYDQINFSYGPDTPGMGGVINFMPAYTSPNNINTIPSRTLIPLFLCPSDRGAGDDWPGQNNYAGNQGGWLCDRGDALAAATDVSPNERQTGIFYFLSRVRSADVTDGMSYTAFFSEKLRGSGGPDKRTDMFVILHQTTLDGVYNTCQAVNRSTATPLTSKWGYSWVMGENCCTQYNHVATPGSCTCAGTGFPGTMTNMAMQVSADSWHGMGVNVMMGDGAVRFTPKQVDLTVWRAMGTRASGDPYKLP